MKTTETRLIRIDLINRDGGIHARTCLSEALVGQIKKAMEEGVELPPAIVYQDGLEYWLGDGYHQTEAAVRLGRKEIEAEIRPGTRRDAQLCSIRANAAHGQRLTIEERHRAVDTLLGDKEWSQFSDRCIASMVQVDHKTVANRRKLLGIPQCGIRRTIDGRVMDTSNIGRCRLNESADDLGRVSLGNSAEDGLAPAGEENPQQAQSATVCANRANEEPTGTGVVQEMAICDSDPVVVPVKIDSKAAADKPQGPRLVDESIAARVPVKLCPHCGKPIPEEWLASLQPEVAA